MKYATEFGHAGHMLPIQINYMVIHHTLTYCGYAYFRNTVNIASSGGVSDFTAASKPLQLFQFREAKGTR